MTTRDAPREFRLSSSPSIFRNGTNVGVQFPSLAYGCSLFTLGGPTWLGLDCFWPEPRRRDASHASGADKNSATFDRATPPGGGGEKLSGWHRTATLTSDLCGSVAWQELRWVVKMGRASFPSDPISLGHAPAVTVRITSKPINMCRGIRATRVHGPPLRVDRPALASERPGTSDAISDSVPASARRHRQVFVPANIR